MPAVSEILETSVVIGGEEEDRPVDEWMVQVVPSLWHLEGSDDEDEGLDDDGDALCDQTFERDAEELPCAAGRGSP